MSTRVGIMQTVSVQGCLIAMKEMHVLYIFKKFTSARTGELMQGHQSLQHPQKDKLKCHLCLKREFSRNIKLLQKKFEVVVQLHCLEVLPSSKSESLGTQQI